MRLYKYILIVLFINVSACAQHNATHSETESTPLQRLAKSDIDEVIEIHQRELMADLKLLMIKLYRRNPDGRHDASYRSIEESVNFAFSMPYDQAYPYWQEDNATDIIRIALSSDYSHSDRVLPFILGLRRMLIAAYNHQTEFYYLSKIDQQKLYNSARNIQVAAWLLAARKDNVGRPLIYSDSLAHEQRNLSFQRLFGEMISTQDNLAKIIAHKYRRLIKTVLIKAASMIFLPI